MARFIDKRLTDVELALNTLPIILVQAAFFLVPLLMTVVLTFQITEYFHLVWSWNLATWADVFSRWYYWGILIHTFTLAVGTVSLCLLIGFPVAYALATRLRAIENHVKVLIIFAFLTDTVLKVYGWALFLGKFGPLNWFLETLGLGAEASNLLFTPWATLLGMLYNLLPFTIFTIYLSLIDIERNLLHAAYDAGASKVRAFWEITLPLCRPGIWAGSALVFVLSLGVFLESKILGGGKSPMTAELIRHTFETRINWPLGAALTLVLMVVAVVAVLLFTRIYSLKRYVG